MSIADRIRDMIAEGDLEAALQEATDFLKGSDSVMHSECIQHMGRLNDYNRRYRLNIISVETMDLARSQVRYALVEVVLKRIEVLSGQTTPVEPAQLQSATVTLNFVPSSTPSQAATSTFGQSTPTSTTSLADHDAARQLVEAFIQLLSTYEVENAAWRAAPFLHRSLLQGEVMQPQFKQNNFYSAHQRFRSYKVPVNFVKVQNTNRTAIGSLRDRDEGEEYVYTLEKTVDNGDMPGTVRVFFPKKVGAPKITLVSF